MFKVNYLVYHLKCPDGICSKWSFFKIAQDLGIVVEQFIAYSHSIQNFVFENLEKFKDKIVVFVDVGPFVEIEKLSKFTKQIIIIDHHKSNFEDFDSKMLKLNNKIVVFDLTIDRPKTIDEEHVVDQVRFTKVDKQNIERLTTSPKDLFKYLREYPIVYFYSVDVAASILVYIYFNMLQDDVIFKIPWFVRYVGDRDIWAFDLKNSKFVNQEMYKFGYIQQLDNFIDSLIMGVDVQIPSFVNYSREHVEEFVNSCYQNEDYNFDIGNDTFVVEMNDYTNLLAYKCRDLSFYSKRSEIGNELLENDFKKILANPPKFVIVYYNTGQEIYVSMRCKKDFDVSKIAKLYDGGGHACAAGFTCKEIPFKFTE